MRQKYIIEGCDVFGPIQEIAQFGLHFLFDAHLVFFA